MAQLYSFNDVYFVELAMSIGIDIKPLHLQNIILMSLKLFLTHWSITKFWVVLPIGMPGFDIESNIAD